MKGRMEREGNGSRSQWRFKTLLNLFVSYIFCTTDLWATKKVCWCTVHNNQQSGQILTVTLSLTVYITRHTTGLGWGWGWYFVAQSDKPDETRMISDWLFLRKFVFDVCIYCFVFVSSLILWILNNFAVWLLSCGVSRRWIDVCFQPWRKPLWLTGLKAPTN